MTKTIIIWKMPRSFYIEDKVHKAMLQIINKVKPMFKFVTGSILYYYYSITSTSKYIVEINVGVSKAPE